MKVKSLAGLVAITLGDWVASLVHSTRLCCIALADRHLRTTLVLEITPTTANHRQPLGHLGITRYSLDVHFFWREHWERCIGYYSCVNLDRNISKILRYDRSKKITAFAETRLVFQNCSISSLVTALLATKFGSSKCRERGRSCRDIKR